MCQGSDLSWMRTPEIPCAFSGDINHDPTDAHFVISRWDSEISDSHREMLCHGRWNDTLVTFELTPVTLDMTHRCQI
jgi:hypothetical protein